MQTTLTGDDWELVQHYLKPIKPLLDDDKITNILVNRFDDIWIDKQGAGQVKTGCVFASDEEVATLIEQISNALSQYFDPVKTPIVNARLPDGSRLCATLPSVTPAGCTLSIRLHRRSHIDLEYLEESGTIDSGVRQFLSTAVLNGDNIIASGATNSGKTTLLNALSFSIPGKDRVVICEDVAEINIHSPNIVQMEAQRRDSNEDNPVTLGTLLATSLRQRPDRIIVGEIRESDAAEVFYQALNTGHRGVYTTLHANHAEAALTRLVTLTSGASRLSPEIIRAEYIQHIDLFLHMNFNEAQGQRRLEEIYQAEGGRLVKRFVYNHHEDSWSTA